VGFLGGRAGQVFVLVAFDHHGEVLTAGEGLFGFDFGAEPRGGGA
jgi:hypothetical protein